MPIFQQHMDFRYLAWEAAVKKRKPIWKKNLPFNKEMPPELPNTAAFLKQSH